jgi:polysaccharide export outer membrane protein
MSFTTKRWNRRYEQKCAAQHIRLLLTIGLTLALSVQIGCQALSTQVVGLSNNAVVTQDMGAAQVTELAEEAPGGPVLAPIERPPAELAKVSLPAYRIEPPDVLLIQAVRMAPKTPYAIQPLDILQIVVAGTPPEQPIAGAYQVEGNGIVNLGPSYGAVKIEGLTLDEAADAITRKLRQSVAAPQASVTLLQMSAQQPIAGEHLVGPDGTINLGIYGRVRVTGLTVDEAREAVEDHLAEFIEDPRVSLDVLVYNSKVFYIITEGAGFGDQVVRIPVTGNETVLDAVAQIGGLTRVSSKKIWISRPAPHGMGCDQVLPVDWDAITRGAVTSTNYQLLPGDRIFVAEDRLIALDALVSKLLNPFERIFGFSLLGAQTVQTLQRFPEGRFF